MDYMAARAIMDQRLDEARSRRLRAELTPLADTFGDRVGSFATRLATGLRRETPEPSMAVADCCVA